MKKRKEKYDLTRETKGFSIDSINDFTILFAAKFISRKVLQKMRPSLCTAGTIVATELCAAGVQLNWSQYLLNELLADVEEE